MMNSNNKFLLPVLISGIILMFIFTGCGKTDSDKIYVNTKEDSTVLRGIDEKSSIGESGNTDNKESEELPITDDGYVYVQVCGAVNKPGVYKVKSTLRVFEVIDVAGGVTEEAETNVINMAKPVMDEMKLYIPAKDEVDAEGYEYTDYDLNLEESEDISPEDDGLVNINEAGEEELMTLPGIGEAKAGAIIAYREENGAFTDISEIMNISGIKQAAFEKIKDLIKV